VHPLLTVGHGTLDADAFAALVRGAGVERVVDVRRYPGSRRHPQYGRDELTQWLPAAGVAYWWEPELGGRRSALPASPNVGLRNASFRAYADYMRTPAFAAALERVFDLGGTTAVMCAESVWWRCHRRLIADVAVLVRGVDVQHLGHDGRLTRHPPTPEARRDGELLVYDGGDPALPGLR
jgi:uncharacterized protein (DUF488 family)